MAINKGMFHHIVTHCQSRRGVLLELGSGETSAKFVEYGLTVYSIEHDPNWIGKYLGVNYIPAPLVKQEVVMSEYWAKNGIEPYWYDVNAIYSGIEHIMPDGYDALLLDGPLRKYRPLFHWNKNVFSRKVPWFADDMLRPEWVRALLWTCRDRGMSTFPEIQGIDTSHAWVCIPAQTGE
ncbi:MAG: hypothetical protein MN733_16050, partial [Nitrososphaera sp.]|nr:hypothetical protein [Nitrososphaera sp.]